MKCLSNSPDKTKVIDERDERKGQRLAIIIAIDERDELKWQRLAIIIAIDERDERKWQRLAIIIAIDERDERKWQRLAIIIAECKHSSSSFSLGSARGITFSRVSHLILLFVGFSELYADPIYICFLSMCSRCWL